MHHHGFVRGRDQHPAGPHADVSYNREASSPKAKRAHAAHVDLVVYRSCASAPTRSTTCTCNRRCSDARRSAPSAKSSPASAGLTPVLLIGAPLRHRRPHLQLRARRRRRPLLGVVPKSYLPNYREYYEKRWFASGLTIAGQYIAVGGEEVPFGTDLLFASNQLPGFKLHVEICEDFWAAIPPSTVRRARRSDDPRQPLGLNIVIGKADERHMLCRAQSGAHRQRLQSTRPRATARAPPTSPGTARGMIYELGDLLAESERFSPRRRAVPSPTSTPAASSATGSGCRRSTMSPKQAGRPEDSFRVVAFDHAPATGDIGLIRPIRRFPFVPNRPRSSTPTASRRSTSRSTG
jgi:NAD+ synthase (glutamine-hydrolysing)